MLKFYRKICLLAANKVSIISVLVYSPTHIQTHTHKHTQTHTHKKNNNNTYSYMHAMHTLMQTHNLQTSSNRITKSGINQCEIETTKNKH